VDLLLDSSPVGQAFDSSLVWTRVCRWRRFVPAAIPQVAVILSASAFPVLVSLLGSEKFGYHFKFPKKRIPSGAGFSKNYQCQEIFRKHKSYSVDLGKDTS